MTLIELLITVVIMGVIGTSLGAALTVVTGASASTRDASVLDAELRRAADAIRATPYVPCVVNSGDDADTNPAKTGYQTQLDAVSKPDGIQMTVTDVKYWDGSSTGITGICFTIGGDKSLQLVTVKVTYNSTLERSQDVVKRPVQ